MILRVERSKSRQRRSLEQIDETNIMNVKFLLMNKRNQDLSGKE